MRIMLSLSCVRSISSLDQNINPALRRITFSLAFAFSMPVVIFRAANLEVVTLAKPVALMLFHTCR